MSAKKLALLEEIRNKNLLKGISLRVYEILFNKPGLTVGEITRYYLDEGGDNTILGRSRGDLAKRVTDLVSWGAIKADGKTMCPYTERVANRYAVTGSLPDRTKPKLVVSKVQSKGLVLPLETGLALTRLKFFLTKLVNYWFVPGFVKNKFNEGIQALEKVLDVAF